MLIAVAIAIGIAVDVDGEGAVGGDVQVVDVWRPPQLLEVLLYPNGVVYEDAVRVSRTPCKYDC